MNVYAVTVIVLVNLLYTNAQDCVSLYNATGTCTPIKQCDIAVQQLKNGVRFPICDFDGNLPIVCCPELNFAVPDSQPSSVQRETAVDYVKIAEEECKKVKDLHPTKYHPYVVGGVDARSQEYLHMAALGFGDQPNVQWFCGGSLISDRHVLTAAHCLFSSELGPLKWVRLGDLDLVKTDDIAEPKDFEIERMIRHPDYKPPQRYHDIAIVVFKPNVRYTDFIKPACIHTSSAPPKDLILFDATGWGLLEAAGTKSDHLQMVELSIFDNEECAKLYPIHKRTLTKSIIEQQLCAGSRYARKDTCNGDSGGPLQYTNEIIGRGYRGYSIIGITSFGKSCGITASPGVYTRVSAYVPWIVQNVWLKQ